MRKTIVAKHDDARDGFALIIQVEYDETLVPDFDIMRAVKEAAREYRISEDGVRNPELAGHGCNWGDFVNHVPAAICARHGFRVVNTDVTSLVVDHDDVII